MHADMTISIREPHRQFLEAGEIARPHLLRAAESPDPEVQLRAKRSLKGLGGPPATD